MVEPRFVYVRGVRADRTWSPESGDEPGREVAYGWRLLGPNNRDLGRSPEVYGDPARCDDAVARLRHAVAAAQPRFRTTPDGRWSWRLVLDGVTVAVAARAYHRQRECYYNLAQFVAAAPFAAHARRVPVHVVRAGSAGEFTDRSPTVHLTAASRPRTHV